MLAKLGAVCPAAFSEKTAGNILLRHIQYEQQKIELKR
jgi:hypothetical protein